MHTKCDTTAGLGNKWSVLNKQFLIPHSYKLLSLSLLSSSYHLIFSQTGKWDSRIFLCWILQQNYLWAGHLIILCWNCNPPFRKVKMCGSKQGSYCSLAANKKEWWLKNAIKSECAALRLQLQLSKTKNNREGSWEHYHIHSSEMLIINILSEVVP